MKVTYRKILGEVKVDYTVDAEGERGLAVVDDGICVWVASADALLDAAERIEADPAGPDADPGADYRRLCDSVPCWRGIGEGGRDRFEVCRDLIESSTVVGTEALDDDELTRVGALLCGPILYTATEAQAERAGYVAGEIAAEAIVDRLQTDPAYDERPEALAEAIRAATDAASPGCEETMRWPAPVQGEFERAWDAGLAAELEEAAQAVELLASGEEARS